MTKPKLVLLLWVFPIVCQAQDLEQIGKSQLLKFSGSVSASQVLYGIKGIENRREPYTYYLNGNLNLAIAGIIDAPFTFTYSNQEARYKQPFNFNQFGCSPAYKWVKAYLGYTSMSFSPYTLNGHQFLGAGVEATPPGGVHVAAMYGRFQKAVKEDTLSSDIVPAYKRIGYAVKVGFTRGENFVDLIIFKASDVITSLSQSPIKNETYPQDNRVISLSGGFSLWKNLKLSADIAQSALTRNKLDQSSGELSPGGRIFNLGMIKENATTAFYTAIKGKMDYAGEGFTSGIGYERLDPGFTTLGSYYFNNDLENYTMHATANMFEGKFHVAANGGLERNNLDHDKLSTTKRVVSAFTMVYNPSQQWNINGTYSNFSSFTNIRSSFDVINRVNPYEKLDTLNFTQITQSTGIGMNWNSSNDKEENKSHHIMLNINYQKASDKQNNRNGNGGASFWNSNVAYSLSLAKAEITITQAFNISGTKSESNNTLTLGPTCMINKALCKKLLQAMLSFSANKSYTEGKSENTIFNSRIGLSCNLKKRHQISTSLIVLRRKAKKAATFTEFTGNIAYSYSF
jgi:hypothetical protein